MKAIAQDRYGSADVLELRDVDKPVVGDDDVLVRVHAAGVDASVWHLMTGQPYLIRLGVGLRTPRSQVRGREVAGRVEAVGRNVTRFQPGDDVFGVCGGSYAEYALAKEDRLAPKPANLSYEQAAAVPVSACTALHALRDSGRLQPGQKVLVIGAGGGVGTYAVQLAKAFGADVTGVCSTSKVDLVKSIGADRVIDYTTDDVTKGTRRFDLILDIAGNRPLSHLRRVLAPRGTLVFVGGEGGGRLTGGMHRPVGALVRSAFTRQRLLMLISAESDTDLRDLTQLIEDGKVTPVIDRTYALGEAPEAIRQWERGHARGKLVVTI